MRTAMVTQAIAERERQKYTHEELRARDGEKGSESSSDTDLSPEDQADLLEWSLSPDGSVYDAAVIIPLMKAQTTRGATFFFSITGTLLLLLLNNVLQFVVMAKVKELTDLANDVTSHKLFSLCRSRNSSFPFDHDLQEQAYDDTYFDCGPLTASLLSSPAGRASADVDGDGVWSLTDAEANEKHWGLMYEKESEPWMVLHHLMDLAQSGHLIAQQRLTEAESFAATKNFTQLPMSWLAKEDDKIELCIATDPNLCGNFEARGILAGRNLGTTPNKRIRECENILKDYCPSVFGQYVEVYREWGYELCGDRTTKWLESERIVTTSYGRVRKYAMVPDAIVSPLYASFLLIMLGIWWMSMLVEMREVMTWWVIVIWYPMADPETAPVVLHESRILVNAIPLPYKAMTVVLNLLPRTILCAWLTYVGSLFLISADDYESLILNGVALAFLIEIDNMLFAAVIGSDIKKAVYESAPLKVSVNHCYAWLKFARMVSQTSLYTIFLVVLNSALLTQAYLGPQGKYEVADALRCLCHAEGPGCVTAQILGSDAFLELSKHN